VNAADLLAIRPFDPNQRGPKGNMVELDLAGASECSSIQIFERRESMKSHIVMALAAVTAMATPVLPAQERVQTEKSAQTQERIYGSQLMTPQEREQHRAKMRSLKTEQERERYRLQHHKEMQQRAKERGVTIPDEPMPRGKGMGPGMGQGTGPGMGGGMGPGGGPGQGQNRGR